MFSLLFTTYTTLDNVDVYCSSTTRRPDSPDTGVSEKQPEKPVEEESKSPDFTTILIEGLIVGAIGVQRARSPAKAHTQKIRKRKKEM